MAKRAKIFLVTLEGGCYSDKWWTVLGVNRTLDGAKARVLASMQDRDYAPSTKSGQVEWQDCGGIRIPEGHTYICLDIHSVDESDWRDPESYYIQSMEVGA